MAGNYPDVPGPRIAYDRDGTQGYSLDSGFTTVRGSIPAANMQAMNKEDGAGYNALGGYGNVGYCLYFPILMDITNAFLCTFALGTAAVSADTTNGVDGTWSTITMTNQTFTKPNARQQITAVSGATGIKALRFAVNGGFANSPTVFAMHLYGKPSAVSDRLEFWHPTLDQSLNATPALLDWGNRPRGTTATQQFRVKNLSSTLNANSITVGMESLTDASPTYVSQHTFALGAGAFAATATIPSLSPGQISDVVTVQQALSTTAALSLWWQRIYATAGSWV